MAILYRNVRNVRLVLFANTSIVSATWKNRQDFTLGMMINQHSRPEFAPFFRFEFFVMILAVLVSIYGFISDYFDVSLRIQKYLSMPFPIHLLGFQKKTMSLNRNSSLSSILPSTESSRLLKQTETSYKVTINTGRRIYRPAGIKVSSWIFTLDAMLQQMGYCFHKENMNAYVSLQLRVQNRRRKWHFPPNFRNSII